MAEFKELTTKEEIQDVFGKRGYITFRCGHCKCAFIQDMRHIRFYESLEGNGECSRHWYVVKTECPTCKKEVSVVADEELAINPRDYWKDKLKEKK